VWVRDSLIQLPVEASDYSTYHGNDVGVPEICFPNIAQSKVCRRPSGRPSHQSLQLSDQVQQWIDFIADAFVKYPFSCSSKDHSTVATSQVDKAKFLSRFDLLLKDGIFSELREHGV
jgi:hypothetical protein